MDEYDDLYPDDIDIDAPEPSKKEIHRYIEQLLPSLRPKERYSRSDKTWMEDVINLAYEEAQRHPFTVKGLLRDWIRNSVLKHDRSAFTEADKFMRKIGVEGQLPLGWGDGDEWKKAFSVELSLPLRLLNDEVVPLGVAASTDFDEWEEARDERFARISKAVSNAHEEGKQGARFFKGLFLRQPKARRADHLFQPDEADQDQRDK